MADEIFSEIALVTYNCKPVSRSVEGIRALCMSADVIALEETWLLPEDVDFIGSIDSNFDYTSKSAVDTSQGVLRGRPYGGVALMWRKRLFTSVKVIKCKSVRVSAISGSVGGRSLLVFSVYMPTDDSTNLPEFTECLSEVSAIIESQNVDSVFILGDFNAHPSSHFYTELCDFCVEQRWRCADLEWLGRDSGTFTFVSDAHGCRRWLDHCLVTEAAWLTVTNVSVKYDAYWSDHFPLVVQIKIVHNSNINNSDNDNDEFFNNTIVWGERNIDQIKLYNELCCDKLRDIDFPIQLSSCCDKSFCNDNSHKIVLDKLYYDIICTLQTASKLSFGFKNKCRRKHVVGWNEHVREAHSGFGMGGQMLDHFM